MEQNSISCVLFQFSLSRLSSKKVLGGHWTMADSTILPIASLLLLDLKTTDLPHSQYFVTKIKFFNDGNQDELE